MWYGLRDTPELIRLLREMAREIAEADGIVPLKPGEIRPSDYYLLGRYSMGRKPLWTSEALKKRQQKAK